MPVVHLPALALKRQERRPASNPRTGGGVSSPSRSGSAASPGCIGVVGGGSVAASFLHHLVEARAKAVEAAGQGRAQPPLRVLVWEPRERIGRGGAYGDDLDTNLLNVTVGAMSVAGDDKGHFKRWLDDNGITRFNGLAIEAGSFVSRPLFGRYLEWVCAQTVARGASIGVEIVHLRQAAEDIRPLASGGSEVVAADGNAWPVEHLVLCLGNLAPTSFTALGGRPGYFESPYPTRALAAAIPADASVGVLGTSLSAVDTILALAASGHRGPITAVSRQGRLPCVRGVHNLPVRLSADLRDQLAACKAAGRGLPLDRLMTLLHGEWLAAAGSEPGEDLASLAGTPPPAAEFLDREIEIASTRPRPWQAVCNAFNELVDLAWHLLSAQDRQRFEREFRGVWMARRVNFPLENALAVRALLTTGQLRVLPGVRSVTFASQRGGFELELDSAGSRDRPTAMHLDCIANATSFSCDAAASSVPILRSLLAQGLASADPFGGLRADFDTGCLVDADGRPRAGLSALGSMVAGTYFWTNAMEVNARLAMGQARRLAALTLAQRPEAGAAGR